MSIKDMNRRLKDWFDDRLGISIIASYLREKKIPQHKHTVWYYTGSAILIFFGIQVFTGIMLLLYYKPTIETAHESVELMMTEIPLGWLIRSIHRWSAYFMIAAVFVHLISILLTKAYRSPRELTWMSGVFLLILTMFFGFTGYLLPWDDLSLSATKVGTDIPRSLPFIGTIVTKLLRGGEDVTGDTLTRFFGIHASLLPLLLLAFLLIHVFLIQKHGMSLPISSEKRNEKVKEIPFWPNFIYREMIVWLVLLGILFTVAIFLPPALDKKADLMAPAPEGVKPEWYFLFLFQTLKIFPAKIFSISGDTIAVFLMLLVGLLFFFIPLIDDRPAEKKGKIITVLACLLILYAVVLTVWSLL
ncbi:MAG: cytochrome bc complex cytochrome b subunit [Candidatus Aminicenantaceae bacterium]